MALSNAPLSGLLRDLGELESRHRDVPFERIRSLLDEDAGRGWRLLVEKYSKFVWSVSLQLGRGLDDPEELSAEIYRRVFGRLESDGFALLRRFQGKCDFRTYLYRMVRTERFRALRHRGVKRDVHERLAHDAAHTEVARATAAAAAAAPSTWAQGLGRAAAVEALRELDPADREILTLRFAGGLKLRELAEALGARDTNDAAYRLRRALGRCQALARARTSADWNEEAFREAAEAFRESLFPAERIQNRVTKVSDPGEGTQEEVA